MNTSFKSLIVLYVVAHSPNPECFRYESRTNRESLEATRKFRYDSYCLEAHQGGLRISGSSNFLLLSKCLEKTSRTLRVHRDSTQPTSNLWYCILSIKKGKQQNRCRHCRSQWLLLVTLGEIWTMKNISLKSQIAYVSARRGRERV